jgi:hypothetical protein
VKTFPFVAAAAAQDSVEATKPQVSFIVAGSDGVEMRAAAATSVMEVAASQIRPCVGGVDTP